MSEEDDWGEEGEVGEEGEELPNAAEGGLSGVGLAPGEVEWPGPGAEPADSPLARAREELVGEPGVARRLEKSFATGTEATRAVEGFVEDADPGRYVPGARGRFEAMAVRDEDDGWYVVVRFVAEGPPTAFLDAGEWAVGWLFPAIRRALKAGTYWCPRWWEHPEAVWRLKALWDAWETARAEGGNAMSYWWTVHFDAHWAVLTSAATGPFASCARRDQHSDELDYLPGLPGGEEEWEKFWRATRR